MGKNTLVIPEHAAVYRRRQGVLLHLPEGNQTRILRLHGLIDSLHMFHAQQSAVKISDGLYASAPDALTGGPVRIT